MKLYYFDGGYRGGIVCVATSREEAARLFIAQNPGEYGLPGVLPLDQIEELPIPTSPEVICEFYGDR